MAVPTPMNIFNQSECFISMKRSCYFKICLWLRLQVIKGTDQKAFWIDVSILKGHNRRSPRPTCARPRRSERLSSILKSGRRTRPWTRGRRTTGWSRTSTRTGRLQWSLVSSVTSKKLLNVCKSCPKMISLEKWKIFTPLQKLTNNVGDLGKNNCCHRL